MSNAMPLQRSLQRQAMRVVNVPMRRLLGLPFPTPLGDRLMLLYLVGRKTGRQYRQPVSYVHDGATLLTPGGGRWKLNLVPGQPVRIRLRGKDIRARPEIVGDIAEVEALLERMAASNPMALRFVGVGRDPDGRLERAPLETAVTYGFRIIRWHLDEPGAVARAEQPRG